MRALVLLSITLGAVVMTAQQPTFRSGTQTVAIYATVQDRAGGLVTDLGRDAFRILDNGKPADITVFSNDIQPITAVVLLDMSGSMAPRFARVQRSMLAFIDALQPPDRIRIGTFGQEIALSPHLTGHKATLTRIVTDELWPAGGGTPLWSAMRAGMTSLSTEHERRVVLLITDGMNTDTHPPGWPRSLESAAVKEAVDREFMVYGIGFGSAGRSATISSTDAAGTRTQRLVEPEGLDPSVVDLAVRTGGGYISVPENADLTAALARVSDELRHQYVLGFSPAVLDGKVHKLEVQTTTTGLTVRGRTSYRAAPRTGNP